MIMAKNIVWNQSLITAKPSFEKFAELQETILFAKEQEIELFINIESRLGLSFLFCLSTLPTLAQSNGKEIRIFCNSKSKMLFDRNGYISKENVEANTNIAPQLYQNSRIISDVDSIYNLVTEITKEAPIEMSDDLAALFTSKVGEMYNNSIEHSGAQYVIGGKYYKNQKNKYCFACYDTGIGIPNKVKQHLDSDMSDLAAFKWAMKRGHSTANRSGYMQVPRGLGLGLLQNFAKTNNGAIRICSGSVLYTYTPQKGDRYYGLQHEFKGTLFEMDIIADNHHRYILK